MKKKEGEIESLEREREKQKTKKKKKHYMRLFIPLSQKTDPLNNFF